MTKCRKAFDTQIFGIRKTFEPMSCYLLSYRHLFLATRYPPTGPSALLPCRLDKKMPAGVIANSGLDEYLGLTSKYLR